MRTRCYAAPRLIGSSISVGGPDHVAFDSDVAEALLDGEILYRAGNHDAGFSALREKDAEAEKVEAQFAEAWKKAAVTIKSSCFCQSGL